MIRRFNKADQQSRGARSQRIDACLSTREARRVLLRAPDRGLAVQFCDDEQELIRAVEQQGDAVVVWEFVPGDAGEIALVAAAMHKHDDPYDKRGMAFVETSVAGEKGCRPLILIDGFPHQPLSSITGVPEVNLAVLPAEIGGAEIYTNPAQIPPQFKIWGKPPLPLCGAVVFWTREKLGLPRAPPPDPQQQDANSFRPLLGRAVDVREVQHHRSGVWNAGAPSAREVTKWRL